MSTPLYSEEGEIDIHGFLSQGYLKSDHNNLFAETEEGTFQFNEMGISFSTEVIEHLNIGMQFFAMDLGNFGNDRITIDWAFGDYRWRDYLGIRVGKIKIPHGLYNEYRDVDSVTSLILYPVGAYNESWREVTSAAFGVGLYGSLMFNQIGKFKYNILAGTTNLTTDSSMMRVFKDTVSKSFGVADAQIESVAVKTSYVYAFFLHNALSVDGLRFGISGWIVDFDTVITLPVLDYTFNTQFTNNKITLSLEYLVGNFRFAYEYNMMDFEFEFTDAYDELDYYYLFSWQFTDWWETSFCYSEKYYNRDDRNGRYHESLTGQAFTSWIKDTALSTRFDINANWSVKLEGHYFDGVALLIGLDNGPAVEYINGVPKYPFKQYWYLFAAKISYNF